MSNTFGKIVRLTTFGESHGVAMGGVIDGIPAGLKIDLSMIRAELDRRKPGQSTVTTTRKESDDFEILSGIYNKETTGAPIGFIVRNQDYRPSDYDNNEIAFRPSHADYSYHAKYGLRDHRGGGRSSARETVSWVVAGAIAKQLLSVSQIKINAFVTQVGKIRYEWTDTSIDFSQVENNLVRCPDPSTAAVMTEYIQQLKAEGDSTGGVVGCIIKNISPGLGEPVFDKLHADLAKAMMSINAAHGFEYGSGFAGVEMKGSEHNDLFKNLEGKMKTETNYSGGIQGGITNGMDIYFRVAFKPVSTISKEQRTVDQNGKEILLTSTGRHDPCVVPRAVPIVEAMAALVIADHLLLNRGSRV